MGNPENEKEKKGGAVPPWMTSAAKVGGKSGMSGSSLLGAAGSGAGKLGLMGRLGAALAAPKVVVALTVAGGLALGGGIVFNNSETGGKMKGGIKARSGASQPVTASASGPLPGSIEETPSALRLAQQANEGALGVPVDPDETADALAGGETADEEWSEDEEAVAEADAAGYGAADGGTEEMDESMTRGGGAAKGALARKFGKLSSGVGGGGGTSARLTMGALGKTPQGAKAGKTRAMSRGQKATVTQGKRSARNQRKGGLSGATARRLQDMSGVMGKGGKNAEATAAEHSQQWDNAPGAGSSLQGSGGSGVGGSDDFGSTQGSGSGLGDSDSYGGQSCPEGWSGSPPDCEAPDADNAGGGGMNMTPYQGMVDMAIALMVIASIFTIAGSWLCFAGKADPTGGMFTAGAMLCKLAAVMAGIVAMLGLAIMGMHGQMLQGGIFTTVGTVMAISSWKAMAKPTDGYTEKGILHAAIANTVAGIIGLLGAAGGHNTRAETDDNGNIINDD